MKRADEISRRDLLRNAGVAAAAGALGGLETQAASPEPAGGKPRTLALIGDRYHNQDYIRVGLDRIFKELGLPIDYTSNYDELSRSLLEPYQLFVALRDNMIRPVTGYSDALWTDVGSLENPWEYPRERVENWITEEQGMAVHDFVAAGNGFYAMHNSCSLSLGSKNYREVMGGAYGGHPPLRPFQVRPTANKHPITEGISPFMVTDEQHYVIYDKDPKYIILEAENIDGLTYRRRRPSEGPGHGAGEYENVGTKSISGWAYEYGKGRLVYTAVGHTVHAMWAPEFLKIQKNAIRWLLRMA